MRVAVIGRGSIGKRHVGTLLGLGHEPIVYDPEHPSEAADEIEAIRASEAVIVCSPPWLHAKHVSLAIDAGKPTLVEKPAATSAFFVAELVKKAKRKKARVWVGYNWRFHEKLSAVIASASERAYHIEAAFAYDLRMWRLGGSPWHKGYGPWKRFGGGIALDASHEIDSIVRAFGRPKSVAATLTTSKAMLGIGDSDAAIDAILMFGDGKTAHVHLDYASADYKRSFEFLASDGPGGSFAVSMGDEGHADIVAKTYRDEVVAFLSGDDRRLATLEESVPVLETIDAMKRSARERRFERPSTRKGGGDE